MKGECKGDALISIHPSHVEHILTGKKTIELRRRALRLPKGARLWIYSTLPAGSVEAVAILEEIFEDSPELIWKRFGKAAVISSGDFSSYFSNCDIAFALKLGGVQSLRPGLSLEELRKIVEEFHPPQFFKKLSQDNPILERFASRIKNESSNGRRWS